MFGRKKKPSNLDTMDEVELRAVLDDRFRQHQATLTRIVELSKRPQGGYASTSDLQNRMQSIHEIATMDLDNLER